MHLFILAAVSFVDIFLLSPLQPRAVDRIMAPPAVLNVAYRPSEQVLARGAFGEITERDLFLFLHMRGAEETDMLRFGRHFSRRAADSDTDPEDAQWIKEQIADLVTVYYLASQVPATAAIPDSALQPLLQRLLSYPAAELIWIDNEVAPKIKIDRADVIHYYRQFESEFKKKGTYEIQQAFIPAPVGQTEVQRREIITYLERLKASLAGVDDWQDVLLQLQRRRPDILVEYRRATLQIGDDAESTFDRNVQELRSGEFSPIFETMEGYYLIQSVKAEPPTKIALAEAEPEIRQTLNERFILNQFNIEIGRLLLKANYQMYVDRWDFLPDEAPVLAIRDFRLFRHEVEQLMSHQMHLNFQGFVPSLALFVSGMLNRELILNRAEKEKYWGDPRWNQGQALAGKMMAALRALSADYGAQHGEETPALLRRYFEVNPDLFARTNSVRLVQITATLRNPDSYLPSDRSYLIENMKKRLEDFVRQADDIMLAPRQSFRESMDEAGAAATTTTLAVNLFDPARFQYLLSNYTSREYTFDLRDIGYIDITGLKPLEEVLEGIKPGHFSTVTVYEYTAATYYIWDERSGGRQTFEELLPVVRQIHRSQNMEQIWNKRQEEALYWGDLKWTF